MVISIDLQLEIDSKRAHLRDEELAQQESLLKENLRYMGDVSLFVAANPHLQEVCPMHKKEPKTLKKISMRETQAMHNAWYYLKNERTTRQSGRIISPEALKSANALINRFDRSLGSYRNTEVFMNIPGYMPPVSSEIPEKIEQCMDYTEKVYSVNPLEAAIHTHLTLVLTQPFDSANKRTARLAQDLILSEAGLPPAIITPRDYKEYLETICEVAPCYAKGDLEGQRPFYDLIAKKVSIGLDRLKGGIN